MIYDLAFFLAISFLLFLQDLSPKTCIAHTFLYSKPAPSKHSEKQVQVFSESARILKHASLGLYASYILFSGSFLCTSLGPLPTQQQPTLATGNGVRHSQCRRRQ